MSSFVKKILIAGILTALAITVLPLFPAETKAADYKSAIVWQAEAIDMGTGYKETGDLKTKAGCIGSCFYTYGKGKYMRLHITNKYGTKPLRLSAIYISRVRKNDDAVMPTTVKQMTVNGEKSVNIPAGDSVWTDFVRINVNFDNKYEYFLFSNEAFDLKTMCGEFRHIKYIDEKSPDKLFKGFDPKSVTQLNYGFCGMPFMDTVEAKVSKVNSVFLLFGDSQTTMSYPERLNDRLYDMEKTGVSVLTDAVAGNCLTHDSATIPRHGTAGIDRFKAFIDRYSDYDVKGVLIMIGSNDIIMSGRQNINGEETSVESLTKAYEDMIDYCHKRDMKVYMSTLIPFEGSVMGTKEATEMRREINDWILSNKDLDGTIDSGLMLRDINLHNCLAKEYDNGDHIHQNELGDQVIAGSIPIKWITD